MLTVAQVRQRVQAVVATLPGWAPSRWSFDAFPQAEPGQHEHLRFAVGVPDTTWSSAVESARGRRALGTGGLVDTSVRVRWVYAIRADNVVDDTDAALDTEGELVKAVLDAELDNGGMHIRVVQLTRRIVGDGAWMMHEAAFVAQHRIELTA